MGLIIICQNVMDIKRLRMKYWLNRCEINNIYSDVKYVQKDILKKYNSSGINNNNGSDIANRLTFYECCVDLVLNGM